MLEPLLFYGALRGRCSLASQTFFLAMLHKEVSECCCCWAGNFIFAVWGTSEFG